jgi:hypothetical protein
MTKIDAKRRHTTSANRKKEGAPRATETKKERVLALLRREGGATLEEIVKESGWLPHSARAAFTGLRKKGFSLERSRTDGVTRYAITAVPSA